MRDIRIDIERKHFLDSHNSSFLENYEEEKRARANEIKEYCHQCLESLEAKGMLFNRLSDKYFFAELLEAQIPYLRNGKESFDLGPYLSEHDFKNSYIVKDSKEILRLKLKEMDDSDLKELDEDLEETIKEIYSLDDGKERNLEFFLENFGFRGGYKPYSEIGNEKNVSKQYVGQCVRPVLEEVKEEREKVLGFRKPYIKEVLEHDFSVSEELARSYVKRDLKAKGWKSQAIYTASNMVRKTGLSGWKTLFRHLQGENIEGEIKNTKIGKKWHEEGAPAKEIAEELGISERTFYNYRNKLTRLGLFEGRNPEEFNDRKDN